MSQITNIEFKARVDELTPYENKLLAFEPDFKGTDHQVDTYFNVPHGRLKLREGNIEHALIQYDRADEASSKQSNVVLYKHQPDPALKAILINQFGIKAVVDKSRRIYFIGNVKFHFDTVEELGHFVEVEAISEGDEFPLSKLQEQCDHYQALLGIEQSQLLSASYGEMILLQ